MHDSLKKLTWVAATEQCFLHQYLLNSIMSIKRMPINKNMLANLTDRPADINTLKFMVKMLTNFYIHYENLAAPILLKSIFWFCVSNFDI